MPNIAKAQAEVLGSGFLDSLGNGKEFDSKVRLTVTEKILAQYGEEFKLKVAELLNARENTGSGNLEDSITPEIITTTTETILRVRLNNYYDYINQGVKGVKSSRNAPNSPYQFKTFGMSKEGRQSLRTYIQSGRAKVQSVRSDKAFGIGLEKKGKSLIDTQVETLTYLIKAYGIKGSKYFTDAFNQVFKDFEPVMAEAVGADIILSIKKIRLGK